MIQVWKCDHCSQVNKDPDEILKHEGICSFNKTNTVIPVNSLMKKDMIITLPVVKLVKTHLKAKKKVGVNGGFISI